MIKIDISYDVIIEKYADLVYRIAISRVKNKEDAEDIFQEVFISLLKNLHKIEDEKHLKHWLIRATLNRAKNYHHCFWKRKVELNNEIEKSNNLPDELLIIDKVRDEINSLPNKFRDLVYLYYYEEYSVSEISEILKIPQGTVKSRLHKTRNVLKDKLLEVYNEI